MASCTATVCSRAFGCAQVASSDSTSTWRACELGARYLGLDLPFDGEGRARIVRDTVRAFGSKEAYVRLLVTRGEGPLGVDPTTCKKPTIVCIVAEIGLYSAEQRALGLDPDHVQLSSPEPRRARRRHQDAQLSRVGAGQARGQAARRGRSAAAQPVGSRSRSVGGQYFRLAWPHACRRRPRSTVACQGSTAAQCWNWLENWAFQSANARSGGAICSAADEVFLTGSGAGVVGVRSLDGRAIGRGRTGEVTLELERRHRALAESEGPVTVP